MHTRLSIIIGLVSQINHIPHAPSGRTVRVQLPGGSGNDYDRLLTAAIDAQFDWVFYAANNYVRLSVIPSSELS